MKITGLNIPDDVKGFYINSGVTELYPPQEKAVNAGLLEGRNIFAAVPTASGKTMIAEMAMFNAISKGGKCLYIVPLRALASEKYTRFKEFQGLGVKTGVSTGDLDTRDDWLGNMDIIVATSEKADSLIRNGAPWIKDITTVIADEVHLIDSQGRGPTLEVVLVHFVRMNPDIQIIALSATVGNADEMAQWLDAQLVESEWRPIDLQEGVFFDGVITFPTSLRDVEHKHKDELANLVHDTIDDGGQCLVFESSRRNAESSAMKISKIFTKNHIKNDTVGLQTLALHVLDTGETETTRRLSQCVSGGTAFHHAGLTSAQRKLIEDGFKGNLIKMLSSTPTLAAGLNLPARRVIIKGHGRYDPNYGMVPIPVLEYKQMAGRAGRPHLDPYGESVLISKYKNKVDMLIQQYVNSDADDVYSKLGTEAAIRTHILSMVSTGLVQSRADIKDFFSCTFFAHQHDAHELTAVVDEVLKFLVMNNFITENNGLHPNGLGELVTMLYIDPMSASIIIDSLSYLDDINVSELSLLHLVCSMPDVRPLYLRKDDYEWLDDFVQDHIDEFVKPPSPSDANRYEWFMSEVKTAVLLTEWISESKEDDITSRFNVGPGDIRAQADNVQWLMYSASRILDYLDSDYTDFTRELTQRISYGVIKELLPIIGIKGIGRVRARKLYNAGYRDLEAIRKAGPKALTGIIGPKVAANTLEYIDYHDL